MKLIRVVIDFFEDTRDFIVILSIKGQLSRLASAEAIAEER